MLLSIVKLHFRPLALFAMALAGFAGFDLFLSGDAYQNGMQAAVAQALRQVAGWGLVALLVWSAIDALAIQWTLWRWWRGDGNVVCTRCGGVLVERIRRGRRCFRCVNCHWRQEA